MDDSEKQHWVGFDLGGTKMMAVVFDDQMKACGREKRKTKAREGAKAGVERIVETIRIALDDAKLKAGDLGGIGIAAPGPLDLDKGMLLELPNLGWDNLPLRDLLHREFKCPVVVANDVDAGVYGEYRFGAARGARCVLGVFPGTGIGGGCVYEGKILRGRTLSCLEIGHLQVLPDGPLCGCGRKGCLETVASRLAISSAAAAVCRGDAPNLAREAGSDLSAIKSSSLAQAIADGDACIERIVREAARWLGVGISMAINLLAPDVVVLGGGLVEALPEIFLKEADKAARARVMPSFESTFKMTAAKLGDDAGVMGAAALVMDALAAARGAPATDRG